MKMYTAFFRGIFAFAIFGVVAVAATLPQDRAAPPHSAVAKPSQAPSRCAGPSASRNELTCPAIAVDAARADLHTTLLPEVRVVPDPS